MWGLRRPFAPRPVGCGTGATVRDRRRCGSRWPESGQRGIQCNLRGNLGAALGADWKRVDLRLPVPMMRTSKSTMQSTRRSYATKAGAFSDGALYLHHLGMYAESGSSNNSDLRTRCREGTVSAVRRGVQHIHGGGSFQGSIPRSVLTKNGSKVRDFSTLGRPRVPLRPFSFLRRQPALRPHPIRAL